MTNTEQYWNDFAATQEELVAEWRENYDPDGELSTLELIERATAREDAPCGHTWITRRSVSGDGHVRFCSICGEIHSADISAEALMRLLPEGKPTVAPVERERADEG